MPCTCCSTRLADERESCWHLPKAMPAAQAVACSWNARDPLLLLVQGVQTTPAALLPVRTTLQSSNGSVAGASSAASTPTVPSPSKVDTPTADEWQRRPTAARHAAGTPFPLTNGSAQDQDGLVRESWLPGGHVPGKSRLRAVPGNQPLTTTGIGCHESCLVLFTWVTRVCANASWSPPAEHRQHQPG